MTILTMISVIEIGLGEIEQAEIGLMEIDLEIDLIAAALGG